MCVQPTATPEVWGGVECTVNRVGNAYMDQVYLTGHAERDHDLVMFAELGLKALRYPVLWERTAPRGLTSADWAWPDARLTELRRLSLTPIVGLVHHGSGPMYTQLDHESYVTGLVEYARAVAQRYPWIDSFCPVNEPLTTARFSGLYGHWYPHARDAQVFARAVLNQCRATVLAMRAIREVNPQAQLVQTEDLGKVYSTPRLNYQAEFENERRWLTYDLLTGTLAPDQPMWQFLTSVGVDADELMWFVDNPCPPEILGCNYYLVGERMLDDRLYLYPTNKHDGNGRDKYVDLEAVRVCGIQPAGWRGLLREAWQRYHLPLAMTEVHLSCHREQQLCWFMEAWQTAQDLCKDGIDIRAVTAWNLLGSFNWNNLVTKHVNEYQPGVFDLGNGGPRSTALSKAISSIARGDPSTIFTMHYRPWWREADRFTYPSFEGSPNLEPTPMATSNPGWTGAPLLIVGGRGTLGSAFVRICRERQLPYLVCSRDQLDITDRESVNRNLVECQPWAVINAAGYVRVDAAEYDQANCYRVNTIGAKNLANACAATEIQFLTFSSDLVFSGNRIHPYLETDLPDPLSLYGRSKAAAERRVLAAYPRSLVVRTSAFFGPWDDSNFLTRSLNRLSKGLPVRAAHDWVISPTYVPDLVHRCLDLLIDGECGIWHLVNEGATSWAEFAERGALLGHMNAQLIEHCPGIELGLRAPRPSFSALGSENGMLLPPLDSALKHYCGCRKMSRPI